MKSKPALRRFLCIASSALLAATSAHAATLYWDGGTANIGTNGNGVSLGTVGDWDNTLGENTLNWDQGAGLAHVAWVNANLDTAFFGGTAGNVTLTDPITVGGLGFFSNSGYTITAGTEGLTFGTGTNHVRMLNVSGGSSAATISGTVTGTGNLVFTSVAPDVGSTLTLSGTSTGGWSGTTAINAGFTLALSGLNQGLKSTTGGITLNGGNIRVTSADSTNEDDLDRISDTAAITSNGGTITYTTTTAASTKTFIETIGSVALTTGQLNLVNTLNKTAGSQTLALSGLTRPGATAAITFGNANALNTTTNRIRVNGITDDTTTGEIIGSWATTGNTSSQTDYAVYDSDGTHGYVVGANIAASDESTWGTSTDAYTANAGLGSAAITLSGTRNITALRSLTASSAVTATNATDVINLAAHTYVDGDAFVLNSGTAPTGLSAFTPYFVVNAAAGTFQLAATQGGAAINFTTDGTGLTGIGALLVSSGNNLGTTGILNASANSMYIAATGTGVVTLPSTSAGQLHVNAGNGPIVIFAPITNNTGALTLVKNGGNTLTLSGTNSYSGGTVLNAGSLAIGNVSNIGGVSANLTFGGIATFAPTAALNFSGGTLTVNSGAFGTITGNLATAFATTTGAGTLRYTSNINTASLNLGNASGLTGNLEFRLNGNAGYTATGSTIQFSSLGDGVGSALQIGGGQSDATGLSQRANIVLNGGAALVFDNRRIEILPRIASNHTVQTTQLRNDSANAAHTWTINTDLSFQVDGGRNFELAGSNLGDNAFNGVISDGNVGGVISFRKDGGGKWILGGNNTYTGSTSVIAGTLNLQHANALGATSGTTTVNSGATLQLEGGYSYAAESLSMAATNSTTIRLQSVSGNNTWNGPITVTGSSQFVRVSADADLLTLAGTITGSTGAGFVLQGASGITVTGQITGGGNVVSGSVGAGAGSIRTLSNATNNYTGATSITGGTLVGIGANAFGDTTGITMGNTSGATLSLRGDTSTDFVKSSDDTTLYSVTTTTATGVTIDVDQATVAGTAAKTMAIGTLTLNAAVTNGITFSGANNTSLSIGAVTTGNSASGTETLTNNISGGGSLTLASVSSLRTGTPTLAFAGTGNTTVTGAITQGPGVAALTKTGSGTLTLDGSNNYAGATTVTAGVLAVSSTGSIANTTGVAVSAGATLIYNSSTALTVSPTLSGAGTSSRAVLGGTGTINASVTLDNLGDTLSPGNSPGILSFTPAQTWSSFSYDWEVNDFTGTIGGTDFDQIGLASTLDLSGGSGSYILNVLGLTALDAPGLVPNFSEINRSWLILTSTGITGFSAANWTLNLAGFTDPYTGTWALNQSGNNLVLSYAAVPEPRAALLGALGVLMLLRRRR